MPKDKAASTPPITLASESSALATSGGKRNPARRGLWAFVCLMAVLGLMALLLSPAWAGATIYTPTHGHPVTRPNSHGDITVTCANLYGRDEKALLEPLVYARVTRINMGVHLVGFELQGRGGAKSRVVRYQQS